MANHYKDWVEKRKKYMRDKCVVCGGEKFLALHHHIYNEDASIFATLCRKCHYRVHFSNNGKKLPIAKAKPRLTKLLRKKYLKEWSETAIIRERKFTNVAVRYDKKIGYDGMIRRGTSKP